MKERYWKRKKWKVGNETICEHVESLPVIVERL